MLMKRVLGVVNVVNGTVWGSVEKTRILGSLLQLIHCFRLLNFKQVNGKFHEWYIVNHRVVLMKIEVQTLVEKKEGVK